MAGRWNRDRVLKLAAGYRASCIVLAAAELDLFTPLRTQAMTAEALAATVGADLRGTTILLDALTALRLLAKRGNRYRLARDAADLLCEDAGDNVLAPLRHHANCLRRWAELARTVKTGRPPERVPSIRGSTADQAAFIGAMHAFNHAIADGLVKEINPPSFRRLLDVGGASGTWTIAFLRTAPEARATIFDLPDVIPMARRRIEDAGLSGRVTLVPGDFYADVLPGGADLVWLSAIAHQNSREQNRALFAKIHAALEPDGTLLLRDVVMEESHVAPPAGTLFAVNMLANTEAGGTYSLGEYREDLEAAGFAEVTLVRKDPWMDAVIRAVKRSAADTAAG